jgi:hypothetical protein
MAIVLPSLQIPVTLMMEAIATFETSVLTGVTRRNIPEEGILHSHRREILKSHNNKINFLVNLSPFHFMLRILEFSQRPLLIYRYTWFYSS